MYAFSSESMESWPLDHQEIQEIPYISVFFKKERSIQSFAFGTSFSPENSFFF